MNALISNQRLLTSGQSHGEQPSRTGREPARAAPVALARIGPIRLGMPRGHIIESLELNVAEAPKPELQELLAGPAVQVSIAILVWECGASDCTSQRVHERFVEVQSADDLRQLAASIDALTNRRKGARATA